MAPSVMKSFPYSLVTESRARFALTSPVPMAMLIFAGFTRSMQPYPT